MRELDKKCIGKKKITCRLQIYIDIIDDAQDNVQKGIVDETFLDEQFKQVMELCDEKIQLSVQAYEQVDKCIQMLDEDLASFTKLLKEEQDKRIQQTIIPTKATPLVLVEQPKLQTQDTTRRRRQPPPIAKPFITDMPIDPNEPVYCYCRKVSFGKMVGCDNENVKYIHNFFFNKRK